MRRICGALAFISLVVVGGNAARADILASSTFDTNPAPADSRLTLNPDGTLTAHYNTLLDTDKVLFPLNRPLTAADTFNVTTRFKILSPDFFADPYGYAQLAFGLVNSITTGTDRSTSLTTNGDTFDMVEFGYFPNVSPSWGGPSLAPTIFSSRSGTESAIPSDMYWVYGTETALDDAGESPLPLDTWLTSTLAYDALTRQASLSLATDTAPLFLNAGGGFDGDTNTIQLTLPAGVNFNVDSFALLLWKDSWSGVEPSVRADVAFDSFSVTAVPEPASLGLLGAGALLLLTRRHPGRR